MERGKAVSSWMNSRIKKNNAGNMRYGQVTLFIPRSLGSTSPQSTGFAVGSYGTLGGMMMCICVDCSGGNKSEMEKTHHARAALVY